MPSRNAITPPVASTTPEAPNATAGSAPVLNLSGGGLGRLPDHLIVTCVLPEVASDRMSLVNFAAVSKRCAQWTDEAARLMVKSQLKKKDDGALKWAVFHQKLSSRWDTSLKTQQVSNAQYFLQRSQAAKTFGLVDSLQQQGRWGRAKMELKSLFAELQHETQLGVKQTYLFAASAEVLSGATLEVRRSFEFVLQNKVLARPRMVIHAEAFMQLSEGLSRSYLRNESLSAACDRALQLWPDYADAHYLRGKSDRQRGEVMGAEQSLLKALSIRAEFQDCRLEYGRLLVGQGRLDEAREVAQELLSYRDGARKQQELQHLIDTKNR